MALPTPTREEREIIVRDKAAREGLTVPDEVVAYIAANCTSDNALKGALLDLAAYAYQRQTPITLQMAELRIKGIRPGVSTKHAAEQTRELEAVPASDITFAFDEPTEKSSAAGFGLPSFLSTGVSPVAEALSEEEDLALEEVPEPTFLAGSITEELRDSSTSAAVTPAIKESVDTQTSTITDDLFPSLEPLDELVLDVPVFAEPDDEVASGVLHDKESDDDEPLVDEPVYVSLADDEEWNDTWDDGQDITEEDEGVSTLFDLEETALFVDDNEPLLESDQQPEQVRAVAPSDIAAPVSPPAPTAQVYFAPMKTNQKRSFVERAGIALQKAGLDEVIAEGDYVAIKVHVGEAGNSAFVSPIYVREVVSLVKELGGKPFLTDANTLYSGQRSNAVDHIACAIHNGFSYATVEAPFIVADGLQGNSWTEVRVDGKHCDSVRMGSAAVEADAMVVISHVKGHGVAGFGGAIKNVGMGLGSRAAKQRMHSDVLPTVDEAKCTHCYKCLKWCPVSAIHADPVSKAAVIDHDVCYGCGECVAACNYGAIAISWETDPHSLQEKMIEHAAGIIDGKPEKMIYLSFLTDITPECDCWSYSDAPIVADIGLLASRDMIAIDQASYDLVVEAVGTAGSDGADMQAGTDKFHAITGTDGTHAIEYGEHFGLGTRRYGLITIE